MMLINNTNVDISNYYPVFWDCLKNNKPLPEELADIFNMAVFVEKNELRGRIEFI